MLNDQPVEIGIEALLYVQVSGLRRPDGSIELQFGGRSVAYSDWPHQISISGKVFTFESVDDEDEQEVADYRTNDSFPTLTVFDGGN